MKNTKRILSLILAVMMCVSLVSLSAFAADGEEQAYVINQDFEGIATGETLVQGDVITKGDNSIPADNKIMEDADGNKFLRIPFKGHCEDTSVFSGNCDTAVHPIMKQISYEDGGNYVFEMDYRYEAKDVAPRLQLQFTRANAEQVDPKTGEKKANSKEWTWINLAAISASNDSIIGVGTLTGDGEMAEGQWNNLRMIFDLAAGTYDTYLNGVLYATEGHICQEVGQHDYTDYDQGLRNVVVKDNKLCVAKLNKMTNTYSDDTVYDDWDIYFDIDDIKLYNTTDLYKVTVNGRDMQVLPNQELSFYKNNQTFVYAVVTKPDTTTELNTSGYLTVDKAGYSVVTTYAGEGALAYEGYELLANADLKAQAIPVYGNDSLMAVANAWTITSVTDQETLRELNTLKVNLTDAVAGKGFTLRHRAINKATYPVVNLLATYKSDATASIDVKLGNAVLYSVQGNAIAGVTRAEGAPTLEAGKAVDVKTVINLQQSKYEVYVLTTVEDASSYVLYGTGVLTVDTIAANALSVVVNKNGAAFAANAVAEISNITVVDGDKAEITMIWDKKDDKTYQSSTELYHIGSIFDLNRSGRTFKSATITYPLPEGAGKNDVAETESVTSPTVEITSKMDGASIELVYSLVILEETFEGMTADANGEIAPNGTTIKGVLPNHFLMTEGEGDAANKFVRAPMMGEAKSGAESNYDKNMNIQHKSFSKKDGTVVLTLNLRPHWEASIQGNDAGATMEFQFSKITHDPHKISSADGTQTAEVTSMTWISLFHIKMSTGMLGNCGTIVEGAKGLTMDAWNEVKLIFNLAEGQYEVWVNGAKYSDAYLSKNGGALVNYGNYKFDGTNNVTAKYAENHHTNVVIPENTLLTVKCNKQAGAYVANGATAYNYTDIDNVTFRYLEEVGITLDNLAQKFPENTILDLTEEGKTLLYSAIKQGEELTAYTGTSIVPVNGMSITRYMVGDFKTLDDEMLRLGAPTGIRFVSVVNTDDFYKLVYNEENLTVKFGTIIAPADVVKEAEEFTKAGLTTVDAEGNVTATNYLEVLGIAGKNFYDRTIKDEIGEDYAFAGSIANIKEANLEKKFVGRGFFEVYEGEGEDAKLIATVYSDIAEDDKGASISDLVFKFLDSSKSEGIGPKFKAYLESYMVEE